MNKMLQRLADILRWLTAFWLVGCTLYLTFWGDERLMTVDGLRAALAMLLIPPAVFFGFSWMLDALAREVPGRTRPASDAKLAATKHPGE